MRRIIVALITGSILLSVLIGCHSIKEEPYTESTNLQTPPDADTTEDVFDTDCVIFMDRFIFDSKDEYDEGLLQKRPHTSFVFFDDISYLGELSCGEVFSYEFKQFNCPYIAEYKLKDKHCSVTVGRYNKSDVEKNENFDPFSPFVQEELSMAAKIEIEGDSLVYHNMPKNDGGYYDVYEYRMDFEHDSVEYRVRYLYSRTDCNLAGLSVMRKVDSYYLQFYFAFNELNVRHNIAHPFAYDMSNEEINKFLSKETAKEAIIKLYESHLSAVEARKNGN